MQMIEDSIKGDFNAVLVFDSSRFARNLEESIAYKSSLKRNNVELISATEPTLDDDSSLITDAMLGALNEMHSRKLSKAVKRGMTFKVSQGIHLVPPPFGYIKKNGVMEVVEEEAKIVRLVFDSFIKTPYYHSVAVNLNQLGIKKRSGKPFCSNDIKRILTKQTYAGNIEYDGILYKGVHTPIIDSETFKKVSIITSKKITPKSKPPLTYKHWLSGLIKCHSCGSSLNFSSDAKGNHAFRCGGNSTGKCAYSNYISVSKVEELISNILDNMIPTTVVSEFSQISVDEIDVKIDGLLRNIKKIDERLERLKLAYLEGIDSLAEYKEKKIHFIKEKEVLQSELDNRKDSLLSTENCSLRLPETFSEIIKSKDIEIDKKNLALRMLFSKIIFNKESLTLTFIMT